MSKGPLEEIKACPYLEVVYNPEITPEQLLTAVKGMDAIVVRSRTKVTAAVIDASDSLKLIVRGGVGVDNIDCNAAEAKGIEVKNTPAASSVSVAELAIACMFALARKIVPAVNSMKAHQWEKKAFAGVELWQKTLGLIGVGRIGIETARRAIGLGMKVIGFDPYVDVTGISDVPIEAAALDDLLSRSDYISIHTPHTEETHNLINADKLALVKPTAFLINCARGGIVDEKALAEALRQGKIAGAALDVFGSEPPTEFPFDGLDNVVLTPHIGAQTAEGQGRVGNEVASILREYFASEKSASV
jgi:D-3-phosphoglycerate dehydrogenase